MEITKLNETYRITDTNSSNNWKMEGTANNDVNGSISINFSVNKSGELEEYIGSCNYTKPVEGNVDLNLNISEENRDNFSAYADTIIDEVLSHFQES